MCLGLAVFRLVSCPTAPNLRRRNPRFETSVTPLCRGLRGYHIRSVTAITVQTPSSGYD